MGFKVKFTTKKLLLQHTWTISRESTNEKNNVFVALEQDGITGWGEAAPNIRYNENSVKVSETLEKMSRHLENCDPMCFFDVMTDLNKHFTGDFSAKSAVDIALLDWVCKSLNIPLYRLWGLDPLKTPKTSFSIGIDSLESIKQKVKEAEEYPILKIKLGKDNDREIIQTIRQVTDRVVRVDVNEAWTDKEKALREIEWLAENNVEFVEQPMPAAMKDEAAWLCARSPLPLIADEAVKTTADILDLPGHYHGINIKIDKSGGLQEACKMITLARTVGLKVMLGCMVSSSVTITAAAHLTPLVDYADLDGNLLISNDPFSGVTVDDGKLILPERPGIGVVETEQLF